MKKRRPERFPIPRMSAHGRRWRQRLRADFRLAIISLFGLTAAAGILPLAVYRFAIGDWRTGAGDLLLVLVFGTFVTYAWCTGRTFLAARFIALAMTAGYLALVIFGSIDVMWAFPILAAGFLLTDRIFASISALATLVLTSLFADRFEAVVDLWSFVITGVLVSLFGLIFATRTKIQQRQLSEIARRDPLTGALNRRALRYALDEAERRRVKARVPTSLLLLDLDHFKSINDAYGHEAGDRVLVDLVEMLESRLRAQDGLFRLGGEEFVVVLPGTEVAEAEVVAETSRRTLASQLESPAGPVTASLGVAELGSAEPVREWLARADEALYRAKRDGRNRVVVASAPEA